MQSREEMKNTAIYEKLINAIKQYFAHKDIYSIDSPGAEGRKIQRGPGREAVVT